jgi:hypothetical protein
MTTQMWYVGGVPPATQLPLILPRYPKRRRRFKRRGRFLLPLDGYGFLTGGGTC